MPTNDWKATTFGDLITLRSGGTPKRSEPSYWDGTVPWVTCKDMKTNRLYDSQDRLTALGVENGTRLVPKETILIVVRGMILAKAFPVAVAMTPVTFNQDLKALEPSSEIDREFLFHWLVGNTYEIMGIVDEAAHGTTRLQTDRLLSLPVQLPPLPLQRKIASILSAYDDLIENNTRRIAILEEMAQAIYREWFVNFRFPGHENVKLVDSPLGQIPEGWEAKPARDVVDIRYGKTLPKTKILSEGEFPVYGAGSVIGFYDTAICEGRTALVTCRGNGSGTIWRTRQTAFVTNNSLMITPKSAQRMWSFGFIELLLKHSNVAGVISGSAQPQITIDGMSTVLLLVPRANTVIAFCDHIDVMNDAVDGLIQKNENLRTTRDVLLPKLISGKLDVEDLDIDVGLTAEALEEVTA